jgi:uncharacterized membrane protein YphA (DoxX/SURF4 family)
MTRTTILILIVLRLAIGWHFLFEGCLKIRSLLLGPSAISRPFNSEGYFRESGGPLAGFVSTNLLGDPDAAALARLTVAPDPGDGSPPGNRLSPELVREWQDYLNRFSKHYDLTPEQQNTAQGILKQSMDQTVRWLLGDQINEDPNRKTGQKEVERIAPGSGGPSGNFKVSLTTAQRIEEYRRKLDELRDLQRINSVFANEIEKARLAAVKAEVRRLRADLIGQPGKLDPETLQARSDEFVARLNAILTAEQKAKGPVPAAPEGTTLRLINWGTAIFLTSVGACLFVGLFTRLACWAGALFLLSTYLVAPPFPWMPTPPQNEGNYVFVNKNVVEMLALLVLATLPTGRWWGLDALLLGIRDVLRGQPSQPAADSATPPASTKP